MKNIEKISIRFWNKVKKTNDCWEWLAYKDKNGYGTIKIEYKTYKVHRISWMINFGEIPNELCVLHKCDNPPCVNPDHLFLGTISDNNKDMARKGRAASGEKNGASKLTEKEVLIIRELYNKGNISQRNLGKLLDISRDCIKHIVHKSNPTWKHLLTT